MRKLPVYANITPALIGLKEPAWKTRKTHERLLCVQNDIRLKRAYITATVCDVLQQNSYFDHFRNMSERKTDLQNGQTKQGKETYEMFFSPEQVLMS